MAQISSGPSVARTDALARGTLRLPDAIAISVSVLAPGMAMLLNVSGVAATSGGSTPLAFLLGGVACLALAFVVIGFTRRMASAGYAYTYASRSLGKGAGFMAGWLYFFGMICFVPMTMSGVAYLATDLLGIGTNWWIAFFFIGMALFLFLSVIRIKVTTRVQLYVAIVTVVVILIVDAVTTAKGGSHGQAASAFTFGHSLRGGFSGVFYGIILGVTSYIGFETAADFGEETSNPRRYIPIAVIAATLFAVVFYLWTTYSITIGYGVNNGDKFAADPVGPAPPGGAVDVVSGAAELNRDEPFENGDLIVGGSAAVVSTRLDDAVAVDGVVGVGEDVVVRQGQEPTVAGRAAADGEAAEGSGRDPVVADGHAAGGGPDAECVRLGREFARQADSERQVARALDAEAVHDGFANLVCGSTFGDEHVEGGLSGRSVAGLAEADGDGFDIG